MNIPLVDLKKQYLSIRSEINSTIQQILDSAHFIGGPEKESFEKNWAKMLNVPHCIGVGNGTDSLFLILKALGIGAGDEVVVPANSFIATSEAVSATGARVVFCDVEEQTFNLDLNLLEEILKKRSAKNGGKIKAIMPVYLYGRMLDMPALMSLSEKYQVVVVEDSAQAHLAQQHGRAAGAWGAAGSFSFYPGKNLGAYGDAGAIVTQDPDLALRVRKMANHGRISKYDHDQEGFNSRLDTLQAAILDVKLKHLPKWTEARITKAKKYSQLLNTVEQIKTPDIPSDQSHVFHLYVVRTNERDSLQKALAAKCIECGVHYPVPLPQLQAYKYLGHNTEKEFPVSFRLSKEILSLPLFPEITDEEQTFIAEAIRGYFQ